MFQLYARLRFAKNIRQLLCQSFDREVCDKAAALAQFTTNFQMPLMASDSVFGDSQAQAGAAGVARATFINAIKALG